MTDEKFKKIAAKILNNKKVTQHELIDLVFYKVEHYQKYYEVLGCALYQLGVYENETMRWTDYLKYEHLAIIGKIETKIETKIDYNPAENITLELSPDEADALAYAMTVYKTVLHTLHRDKIKESIKDILNAMIDSKKEEKSVEE